jgi:prepilin-type N-terminal cleavage/methylation domain-containing protein
LPRNRGGFTILELMVALTLSAAVLLVGRTLIEQVAATAETIAAQAASVDSVRFKAAALRAITRNIETDPTMRFTGDARAAKFVSWCAGGERLRERCSVSLMVDTVVTITDSSRTMVVMQKSVPGVLRYLGDARDGGHWYRSWGPEIMLPLAIGIVFGSDTTVLRIGDRG